MTQIFSLDIFSESKPVSGFDFWHLCLFVLFIWRIWDVGDREGSYSLYVPRGEI